MSEIEKLAWSATQLGEAIPMLCQMRGLSTRRGEVPAPPSEVEEYPQAIGKWINSAASWMGVEAEPLILPYRDIESLLYSGEVLLLRLPGENAGQFLAICGARKGRVQVLGTDSMVEDVSSQELRRALCHDLESSVIGEIDTLLERAQVSEKRREKVRLAMLEERLGHLRIGRIWRLTLSPGAPISRQIHQARLPRYLAALLGVHTLQYFLWLLSWWLIGRGALSGRLDPGWLFAWALLLLTLIPFRLVVNWLQGVLAITAGALFKRRLLYGALKLKLEESRNRGTGELLGRVIESESVESLAIGGGLSGLTAVVELVVASCVLLFGAGSVLHLSLLVFWLLITAWLGKRHFILRHHWTRGENGSATIQQRAGGRLGLTEDLTERMVGHRTRLLQQPREKWHEGEDSFLEHYLKLSQEMDKTSMMLVALVARGWLVLGMIGLAPAFVLETASPAELAIGLGGVLLVYRALRTLMQSLGQLTGAFISWEQIAPLFHAADVPEVVGSPALALKGKNGQKPSAPAKATVVEAHDLVFRYQSRPEPVLKGCSLAIAEGDRVLIEGASGCGKTTFAALLTGLREPDSGLVLFEGMDLQTLGFDVWRRCVLAAPQFHENHIVTETFAFNLLMGRGWPPYPEELAEAEEIARELGLGDLLEHMPAGMLQMVGETGWQLSHGEKSRLYIARALLQNPELMILDESFAALDPENLELALRCVLKRARTLLVIAHP